MQHSSSLCMLHQYPNVEFVVRLQYSFLTIDTLSQSGTNLYPIIVNWIPISAVQHMNWFILFQLSSYRSIEGVSQLLLWLLFPADNIGLQLMASSYQLALMVLNAIEDRLIDGLMEERRNSIANTMELRLSCINPSKCVCVLHDYSMTVWARDLKSLPVEEKDHFLRTANTMRVLKAYWLKESGHHLVILCYSLVTVAEWLIH